MKRKERKQLIEIDPAAMQKFERNVNSVIEQIKSWVVTTSRGPPINPSPYADRGEFWLVGFPALADCCKNKLLWLKR